MRYFTEVAVPPGSNLIGRQALDVKLFQRDGVRLIDVIRGDASLRRDFGSVVLQEGDRVVLRTAMTELLTLQRDKSLRRVDQLSSVPTTTVEVLITPAARMVGRGLATCGCGAAMGSIRWRSTGAIATLAPASTTW
jgi:hypothetical protein